MIHDGRHHKKNPPLVDLVDMIDQSEGVHKINTILFSISLPQLRVLQELALESGKYDFSSAEYKVMDIANYRLFKPSRSDVLIYPLKLFMTIKFMKKQVKAKCPVFPSHIYKHDIQGSVHRLADVRAINNYILSSHTLPFLYN